MSKITFATVFIFFSLSQLYAQNKTVIVKNIDRIVAAVDADSSAEKTVMDLKTDSGRVAANAGRQITVFHKANRILKISYCSNCRSGNPLIRPEGGIFIDYYLADDELCFVNRLDRDYSRPGSCGYVNINHRFYFKNDKLVKSVKSGFNPCDPPGKMSPDIGADVERSNFKRISEIVKAEILLRTPVK